MGTNDFLGGFNHSMQSFPVLPDSDVSSQNAFFWSSVNKNLPMESSLHAFTKEAEHGQTLFCTEGGDVLLVGLGDMA